MINVFIIWTYNLNVEAKAFSKLSSGKHLQIALDIINKKVALDIARTAGALNVSVIEAGTPLIKRYGTDIIKELKKETKEALILADMKSADVGDIEVKMAAEAGADIVTVLGCASNETIQSAKEESEQHGILLEVDLINLENPEERMKELEKIGVKAFSFHVPIDVQKKQSSGADKMLEKLRKLEKGNSIISVAGGLNPERINAFKGTGVNVFVVGGYITSSVNFDSKIRAVLNAIKEL
jgi:3-hexulose-6-phosphate synthase